MQYRTQVLLQRCGSQLIQSKYYCERGILTDPYHEKIVQEKLARPRPDLLAGVVDEIAAAVREHFEVTDGESARLFARHGC